MTKQKWRVYTFCMHFKKKAPASSTLPSVQAVIRGQQQSRWLRSFLSAKRRRVVNIYLEDDQQLDQVYMYLSQLYTTAVAAAPSGVVVKSEECVPFVLDVLLPEVGQTFTPRFSFLSL